MLVAATGDATAMELDQLLSTDIPGYGGAPVISVLDRPHPEYSPIDIDLGDIVFDPKIVADAGYDTEPNGVGSASGLFEFDPSLSVLDREIGLGAYVAGNFTAYPRAPEQNISGYTVAAGEHAILPGETVDLKAAVVALQETGFGLNTIDLERPIGVLVRELRGGDAIVFGMMTLTPQFIVTDYRFDDHGGPNRTDYRQSLTGQFAAGPAQFVARLAATESGYADSVFNANTYSGLAGIADQAAGLWNFRLLGGIATRQPVAGSGRIAPVLEASISWMPTDLDSLQLDAARELDDPDQESATGYTLSETDISVAHEYLRNVIMTAAFKFSHADYFNTPEVESLYSVNAGIAWHLNRAVAVDARYGFNDRQANFLKAADQHIFDVGVIWSP